MWASLDSCSKMKDKFGLGVEPLQRNPSKHWHFLDIQAVKLCFYVAVKETTKNTPSQTHDEESSANAVPRTKVRSHGACGKVKPGMMNNQTLQDAQVVTRQKHLLGLQCKYASSLDFMTTHQQ